MPAQPSTITSAPEPAASTANRSMVATASDAVSSRSSTGMPVAASDTHARSMP